MESSMTVMSDAETPDEGDSSLLEENDVSLFRRVEHDLEATATVGWKNSYTSLEAALRQYGTPEGQHFLRRCLSKILHIMLDQHPSKLGTFEKGCVTTCLARSMEVLGRLAHDGQMFAIPAIAMVFNRRRVLYKEIRPSPSGMTSYWNKLPGAPELRLDAINTFAERGGFEALTRMLCSYFQPASHTKERDFTLNWEDVRILVVAVGEVKTKISPDAVEGISACVLEAISSLPVEELKKESTEVVGGLIQDVLRLADFDSISQRREALDKWLRLVRTFITSSSLPQRLFGYEQLVAVINKVKQMRGRPIEVIVRHAGSSEVNGLYNLEEEDSRGIGKELSRYIMQRPQSDQSFALFSCTTRLGARQWFVAEADASIFGPDKESLYYQYKPPLGAEPQDVPPSDGWMPVPGGAGRLPAPTMVPVYEKVEDEGLAADHRSVDDALVQWILESQIIEDIFGDRIHREIVSRCYPITTYLLEQGALSEAHLARIWSTSTSNKDTTLIEEMQNLCCHLAPLLPDPALVQLLDKIKQDLDQADNFPQLASLVEKLAKVSVSSLLLKPPAVLSTLMDVLWALEQNPKSTGTLLQGEFFMQALKTEAGWEKRESFIAECLETMKKASSRSPSSNSLLGLAAEALEARLTRCLESLRFLLESYGTEQESIIVALNSTHGIQALLFSELQAFLSRSLDREAESHRQHLRRRLELLRFVHGLTGQVRLSIEHVKTLWDMLHEDQEKELLFAFLADAATRESLEAAFGLEVSSYIFKELMGRDMDLSRLGHLGYKCFHKYFVLLNPFLRTYGGIGEFLSQGHSVKEIQGIDTFWKVALDAQAEDVAGAAADELLQIYEAIAKEGFRAGLESAQKAGQSDLFQRIFESLEKETSALGEKKVEYGGKEERMRHLIRIQRSIGILRRYLSSIDPSPVASHGAECQGNRVVVHVKCQKYGTMEAASELSHLVLEVQSNETLGKLRRRIAAAAGHSAGLIRVISRGRVLENETMTLTKLMKITKESHEITLVAVLFNEATYRPTAARQQDMEESSIGAANEPSGGLAIASADQYLQILFHLLDCVRHPKTSECIWNLLMLLPTSVKLKQEVREAASPALASRTRWKELLGSKSLSRSVYILQIIDAYLRGSMAAGPSVGESPAGAIDRAEDFLTQFMFHGGFEEVLHLLMNEDEESEALDAVGLRIINFCLFEHRAKDPGRQREKYEEAQAVEDDSENEDMLQSPQTKINATHVTAAPPLFSTPTVDYGALLSRLAKIVLTHCEALSIEDEEKADQRKRGTEEDSGALSSNLNQDMIVSGLRTIEAIIDQEKEAVKIFLEGNVIGKIVENLLLGAAPEQVRSVAIRVLLKLKKQSAEVNQLLLRVMLAKMSSVCSRGHMQFLLLLQAVIASDGLSPASAVQLVQDIFYVLEKDEVRSLCYTQEGETSALSPFEPEKRGTSPPPFSNPNSLVQTLLLVLQQVLSLPFSASLVLPVNVVDKIFLEYLVPLPSPRHKISWPLCGEAAARRQAFDLLLLEMFRCPASSSLLLQHLFDFINGAAVLLSGKWNIEPDTDSRGRRKYAGLHNQGFTCYMNAFLQQLFMISMLRKGIITAPVQLDFEKTDLLRKLQEQPEDKHSVIVEWHNSRIKTKAFLRQYNPDNSSCLLSVADEEGEKGRCLQVKVVKENLESSSPSSVAIFDSNGKRMAVVHYRKYAGLNQTQQDSVEVLRQVQRTFCYLSDSVLGWFDPKELVDACRCLNLEFSVYQQNDASEFCDKLLDRLETALKLTSGRAECLERAFGGKWIFQKVPQGCNHRYEREEAFIRVELQIRGKNSIEESLNAFIEGELMDGDNKVECENCGTKKDTMRRTCFGTLPQVLILHLKRFDLDYSTFETVKLNSRCSFPMELNMLRYTKRGIEQREREEAVVQAAGMVEEEDGLMDLSPDGAPLTAQVEAADGDELPPASEYEYSLVGVLVHSGVAQGGHYYSFIQDRETGQWFKFDDDDVSEFDPSRIEQECFGGKQTRVSAWGGGSPLEMEVYNNALMLFYEKRRPAQTKMAGQGDERQEELQLSSPAPYRSVFEQEVQENNLQYFQKKYLFDPAFLLFMQDLLKRQSRARSAEGEHQQLQVEGGGASLAISGESIEERVLSLSLEYLFTCLVRFADKHSINHFVALLKFRLHNVPSAGFSFLSRLLAELAAATNSERPSLLRTYFLECPDFLARQMFVQILVSAVHSLSSYRHTPSALADRVEMYEKKVLELVICLEQIMDGKLGADRKALDAVFLLVRLLAEGQVEVRRLMCERNMVGRLVAYLLGPAAPQEVRVAFPGACLSSEAESEMLGSQAALFLSLGALLGVRTMTSVPLLEEGGRSRKASLTLQAVEALTSIFFQLTPTGEMSERTLRQHLAQCGHGASEAQARSIYLKYRGKSTRSSPSSSPSKAFSSHANAEEMTLEGFLAMYQENARLSPELVWHDLKVYGYGEDLKRGTDSDMAEGGGEQSFLSSLPALSQKALINEAIFEAGMDEESDEVADIMLSWCTGNLQASSLFLKVLLQTLYRAGHNYRAQLVIELCERAMVQLLQAQDSHFERCLELCMVGDLGLITRAAQLVEHHKAAADLSHAQIIDRCLHAFAALARMPAISDWLLERKAAWEWMYNWLQESIGSGEMSLYIARTPRNESPRLKLLNELGALLGHQRLQETIGYMVEGAGSTEVNGFYRMTGRIWDKVPLYIYHNPNTSTKYTLFRCQLPSGSRRWYISVTPENGQPGTAQDVDFYFVPVTQAQEVPPQENWKVWTKNLDAREPPPTFRSVHNLHPSASSDLLEHAAGEDLLESEIVEEGRYRGTSLDYQSASSESEEMDSQQSD